MFLSTHKKSIGRSFLCLLFIIYFFIFLEPTLQMIYDYRNKFAHLITRIISNKFTAKTETNICNVVCLSTSKV